MRREIYLLALEEKNGKRRQTRNGRHLKLQKLGQSFRSWRIRFEKKYNRYAYGRMKAKNSRIKSLSENGLQRKVD